MVEFRLSGPRSANTTTQRRQHQMREAMTVSLLVSVARVRRCRLAACDCRQLWLHQTREVAMAAAVEAAVAAAAVMSTAPSVSLLVSVAAAQKHSICAL